jgi:hypothetical protein
MRSLEPLIPANFTIAFGTSKGQDENSRKLNQTNVEARRRGFIRSSKNVNPRISFADRIVGRTNASIKLQGSRPE